MRVDQLIFFSSPQVFACHFGDQFGKGRLWHPSQLFARHCRVAQKGFDFSWAEILFVDLHDATAILIVATFVDAASLPRDMEPNLMRRRVYEIAHRILHTGRDHEILGHVLLQHQPLHFDIVTRVAPIAFCV